MLPLSVLSFVVPGLIAPRVAHAQNLGFTEFPITSGYARPLAIVTGPDGNLWFSEATGPNIGKITPSGTITEYPVPANSSFVQTVGITNGPDGNLWFSDWGNNAIGKITTSGSITEYPIPTAGSGPYAVVTGSYGNLWFYESNTDKIGQITPGGTIAEFPISSGSGGSFITAGPDGNLWFAETSLNKIGRLTPTGTLTEFATAAGSAPLGISPGPDGNIWFTENGSNNIGVMNTSGAVLAEYPVLTASPDLADITVGPNGNLWFAEHGSNTIGQITTDGSITEYGTGTSSQPFGIATGPDGTIWYTGYGGPSIGRYAPNACAALTDTTAPGIVASGSTETVNVTLASCGAVSLSNATTTSTTTAPSGCPAAPSIPSFSTSSLAFGQTDPHTTPFAAPSCAGTYTIDSETTVGQTVMASTSASYQVLGVGDGLNYRDLVSAPTYVAAGSDGNLWYTGNCEGSSPCGADLMRVTPTGTHTFFDPWPPGVFTSHLSGGPDGNLYVALGTSSGQSIAQVSISGAPSENWRLPVKGFVNDIAPGPDGNMWFTSAARGVGYVGFVTPGAKFKQFTLAPGSGPLGISSGSDGAVWFTLESGNIGRITTSGTVTTFAIPGALSPDSNGGGVTLGPDGNVWLTAGDPNSGQNYVLSVSPTGVFHAYPTLTPSPNADGITTGSDGNLWFNESQLTVSACSGGGAGAVGRVTPAGVMSDFGAGCIDLNDQFNIVAGPDGNVWNAAFYNSGFNLIAIGAPGTCSPLAASATPSTVAHGTAETVAATVANCSASEKLMKLVSKLVRPSNCGAPITTTSHVPLQPFVQTVLSNSFTAPKCKGAYTDNLILSSGGTVVATKSVTYKVT